MDMTPCLKNSSRIRKSPQTGINVTSIFAENLPGSTTVCEIVLAELPELQVYTKVTITAIKAMEVKEMGQLMKKWSKILLLETKWDSNSNILGRQGRWNRTRLQLHSQKFYCVTVPVYQASIERRRFSVADSWRHRSCFGKLGAQKSGQLTDPKTNCFDCRTCIGEVQSLFQPSF